MSSGPSSFSRVLAGPWARFVTARHVIPAILLLAIVLRLGVILAFPISPRTDSLWYLERGREIAAGMGYQEGGFPTAFWPVGYSALIALATGIFGPTLFGPILFNLVAQVLTIVLILWLARALGAGEGAARLAALFYALYPAHIAGTGDTAAEPTATLVMMAGIALVVKARGRIGWTLAGGLVLGLATLMRPQVMLFPPFLVGALWLAGQVAWRRALVTLVLVVAGLGAAVVPWTLRNQAVLGAAVPVSTNGGIALQAGANDLADGGYFQVERSPLWAQVGIPFADRVERQVEIDRRLKAMAMDWIERHPVRWGLLGFRKTALLWLKDGDGFWALDASHPGQGLVWKAAQAANQLFYMVVVALAVVGAGLAARAALGRRAGAAMLVAAVVPLFCTALAFGFTGQTRYHYPAMPFVMILAAWVVGRAIARVTEPSGPPAAMPGHGR
ncbi:glycosyltransferase family 39 protein [Sphingomonas sp. CFBP8993]|uniref:glycosyltransferase family 39 protein n=1 Tax=Sphingomonas sp. CFBP8993 TaxID=3096526 RepID=UPI002A6B29BD|nr:glycosyltransferase family 39 protein [Sphingomonas sp. CFBP8993]MDY0960284.1 glycosyltransferase family 39 protein [Sphingomonas sp. CFBP8993]